MRADFYSSGKGLDNKAVWVVLEQSLTALWESYEDRVRTLIDRSRVSLLTYALSLVTTPSGLTAADIPAGGDGIEVRVAPSMPDC